MKKTLRLYMSFFGVPLAFAIAALVIGDISEVSAAPPTEKKCTDGVDNDQDGLTDADDPDCIDGGGGGGANKGRGENSPGIITVLTDTNLSEGLFSDDADNDRYYALGLDDVPDPHNAGSYLDDGDCVTIITPAADGVDNGKLILFAPFGTVDCADTEEGGFLRQIKVLGADLDGDGTAATELVDARFGCNDVFPNYSPIPGVTVTSCSLEIRQYDETGEFERTGAIEWSSVNVTHLSSDVRQLDAASLAEILRYDAPAKGNGKKDIVSLGFTHIPFSFEVTRLQTP